MGGDVAKARTRSVRKHADGFVSGGGYRSGAPELTKVIGIHGTHATIARAMHTNIPSILTVKDGSFFIIVEVEDLFDLGVHPKGESQKHKD